MQNERIKNQGICHVLWECPFARNAWSMASRRIQKCSNSISDFFELFQTMITRLNQQELESWAVIVWAVWNARNKFYFEKTQLQPRQCQCFGSLNRLAAPHGSTNSLSILCSSVSFHCCIFFLLVASVLLRTNLCFIFRGPLCMLYSPACNILLSQ